MSWPALTDHLATLTEQDILEYYECFEKMHGALYRRDLWAAAYLIGGGCSDDSFIDFRAGLIAQGHEPRPPRFSGHEQVFWDALAARGPRDGPAELGEDFDFDDDQEMRRRQPRLFRSIHSASRDLSSTAWLTNKLRTPAAGQARCGRLPS